MDRNKKPLCVVGLAASVSLAVFSVFALEGSYVGQGAAQAFWGTLSLGILQMAKYIRTTDNQAQESCKMLSNAAFEGLFGYAAAAVQSPYYGAVIVTAAQGVGLGICYASSPRQSQEDRNPLLETDGGLDFPNNHTQQDASELP